MAAGTFPQEVVELLANPTLKVVGIGGVLNGSIKGQTRVKESFRLRDVRTAITKRLNLTDEEIGGEYASTDLSNLIMVDGYMEYLGISEVHPLDVDMTDGVLISPSFWE